MKTVQVIAYAGPALPLAVLGLPVYAYLPKLYADLPLIGLTMAGVILLATRLVDVLSDPVIGALVDTVRAKIHPLHWMVAGSFLLIVSMWFLFSPTADASAAYLAFFALLTFTAWTLVTVPYYGWGAELSKHSETARKLAGYREAFVLAGALIALIVVALPLQLPVLQRLAMLVSFLLPLTLWIIYTQLTPEKGLEAAVSSEQQGRGAVFIMLQMLKTTDHSTRFLLLLHFFNSLAVAIPAVLFLFFADQVLQLSAQASGALLLLYFVSGIAGMPVWLLLSKKYGELKTWRIAVTVCALCFLPAVFLDSGDVGWFVVICIVTGFTVGADVALPAAILAGVSTVDGGHNPASSHSSLFSLFTLLSKLALAFAAGIALPVLDYFSSDNGSRVLPWLYAGFPAVIKLVVAWLMGVFLSARMVKQHQPQAVKQNETQHSQKSARFDEASVTHSHKLYKRL